MRKKLFPNPFPDGFYTGDDVKHPTLGLLEDYYAWEWGDALFVALDPFWFSDERKGDIWSRSLGETQYHWLRPRSATEYGYLSGKILGAPGYMRITVAPDNVTAELVRSYLPENESSDRRNHEVAFSYSIPARWGCRPVRAKSGGG